MQYLDVVQVKMIWLLMELCVEVLLVWMLVLFYLVINCLKRVNIASSLASFQLAVEDSFLKDEVMQLFEQSCLVGALHC